MSEPLERRLLLVTFTVNGTAGNDTISLDVSGGNVVINLNGTPQSMSDATVTDIVINGLAGNDTIEIVRNSDNPTTINAGNNDDTIRFSQTNQLLSQITSTVTVNGNAGTDSLIMSDNANPAAAIYVIRTNEATLVGVAAHFYTTIENFTFTASNSSANADRFFLDSTAAGTTYTLNANNGDDLVEFSNTNHKLSDIFGAVTYNGNGGTDRLVLYDNANTTPSTYTVTSNTVATAGMGTLTHGTSENVILSAGNGVSTINVNSSAAGIIYDHYANGGNDILNVGVPGSAGNMNGHVIVRGGDHNDTINVEAASATASIRVDGGPDNDTIRLAPTNQVLSQLGTDIIVDGVSGTDSMTLFDNGSAAAGSYSITTNTVTAPGMDLVYLAVDGVTLNTNNFVDTINVESTLATTSLVLNCSGGNDSIHIAPTNKVLSQVAGTVTINGDDGIDSLTFHDNANPAAAIYTIESNKATLAGVATHTYGTMETFTFNASNSSIVDRIFLDSTAAGTTYTLNANDGDDLIEFSRTSQRLDEVDGAVTYNGNGGTDQLVFYDNANPSAASYTITSTTVATAGMGTVTYGTIENVTLGAANTANTINLNGTTAGTSYNLNGNDGADTVRVGVPGNGAAIVSSIVVRGGAANDTVNVEAMSASATLSVNTDNNVDNIQIAPTNKNLSQVAGAMSINGSTETDSLTLYDNSGSAASHTITSTSVTSTGMGTLTYQNLETLTLNANNNANTIQLNSTLAGTSYTLNANNGNDTVTVGVPGVPQDIVSSIVVSGGDAPFGDVLKIEAMSATASVSATGDSDRDSFQIAPTNRILSQAAGSITIDGNNGQFNSLSLFDDSNSASTNYSITSSAVMAPGMGTLSFTSIRSVSLRAGSNHDTINVHSGAPFVDYGVQGNDGNDAVHITPTNQILSQVGTQFSIQGGNGIDSLTLHDNANPTAATYTISSSSVSVTGMVDPLGYSTLENLNLNAGNVASTINLNSSAAGTSYILNGNNGIDTLIVGAHGSPGNVVGSILADGGDQDDTIHLRAVSATATVTVLGSDGNDSILVAQSSSVLSQVAGIASVHGGNGTDSLTLYDDANPLAASYTISASAVTGTGMGALSHSGLEALTLNAGSGGNDFNVDNIAAGLPVTVNGGSGDDDLFLAFTSGTLSSIASQVTFHGSGGSNLVELRDQNFGGGAVFTVANPTLSRSGFGGLVYSTVSLILRAGSGDDTFTVSEPDPLFIDAANGLDTFNIIETLPGAPVTVDGGSQADVLNINSDDTGVAHVLINAQQDLSSVSIGEGGMLEAVAGGANFLLTASLSIDVSGKLDLHDNDMILDYTGATQLAAIQNLINSARNGGAWDGPGITSSTAATAGNTTSGAMEATDYDSVYGPGALFNGIDPDDTAILVKYTYYGDADYNGAVDFDDYVRADAGINGGLTGWLNGDFDGGGSVDFDDYVLIDLGYNLQGPPL